MWFPRPRDERDVVLLEPSGPWSARDVLDLLNDPTGTERRHEITGAAEGSAKPATRLLESGGWVLETRVDRSFESSAAAEAWLLQERAAGRRAAVWHPRKVWAVIGVEGRWRPLTMRPRLKTLRELETFAERSAAWTQMIEAGLDVHRLHGIGLDLNPSNFGREDDLPRLHYLDEEIYDGLSAASVAEAIVARIPEEPGVSAGDWHGWGTALRSVLAASPLREIEEEVARRPLPERWTERRLALLDGLHASRATLRPSARPPAEITCVMADIHGNLSALDAVLRDAYANGVNTYLFLGDAVGYGPEPAQCVRRLAELPRATCIRGNHDHAIASGNIEPGMNSLARECAGWTRAVLGEDELTWLGTLPVEHAEEGWLAVHGSPRDPHRFFAYVYELTYEENLRCLRDQKIPICFHGHTHVQTTHVELAVGAARLFGERSFVLTPRHTWLVNPGSVGQPRDGDTRAAYALWNRRTGELVTRRVAYDVSVTVRAIRDAHLPLRLAERLEKGS